MKANPRPSATHSIVMMDRFSSVSSPKLLTMDRVGTELRAILEHRDLDRVPRRSICGRRNHLDGIRHAVRMGAMTEQRS